MIVKTILLLMNRKKRVKIAMWLVLKIIWNVNQLQFVSNPIGFVMETTIVEIILTKMNSIAVLDLVHQILLDVLITDAFQVGKSSLWNDLFFDVANLFCDIHKEVFFQNHFSSANPTLWLKKGGLKFFAIQGGKC